MGRPPKPYFWKARGEWVVTIRGERHRLGPDRAVAQAEFHRLMLTSPMSVTTDSLAGMLDAFLTWTQQNRSPRHYEWCRDFCRSFHQFCPRLLVADATPAHVTRWLQSKTTWNNTTRRGAVTCLKRAFNWAEANLGTPNPIRHLEKPAAARRIVHKLDQERFVEILRKIPDRNFRKLLLFCWDTGARPQEAKSLTWAHVDLERRRCCFAASESKGHKEPRTIYLPTDRAVRLVQQGIEQERIFLNSRGRPWTAAAVKCAFARLEERIGVRYTQYDWRHAWITRKLQAGVDSHVVAALAGHSDTKMLETTYSHVKDDSQYMLGQAGR
jgi:integrase